MCWFKRKMSDAEMVSEIIKKEKPELENLFSNIGARNEADKLYHQLAVKVHPDQYECLGDEQKLKRATELFAELQKVKTDIVSLKALKSIIETEFSCYEMQ